MEVAVALPDERAAPRGSRVGRLLARRLPGTLGDRPGYLADGPHLGLRRAEAQRSGQVVVPVRLLGVSAAGPFGTTVGPGAGHSIAVRPLADGEVSRPGRLPDGLEGRDLLVPAVRSSECPESRRLADPAPVAPLVARARHHPLSRRALCSAELERLHGELAMADGSLQFPRSLWFNCMGQLHRRGRGLHESGCFVLGMTDGPRRRSTRCVYYDGLDPRAYASGVCVLHGGASRNSGRSAGRKVCRSWPTSTRTAVRPSRARPTGAIP